jgi:hypothetical protein
MKTPRSVMSRKKLYLAVASLLVAGIAAPSSMAAEVEEELEEIR